MTVPITGSVKDVTGVEDNETPWSFASVIRFAEDGSVITEKPREVRAVSGNLKVNLVPGYAIVTYGKHVWQVTVPDTPTTLKALIEAGVAFPPDTPQALLDAAVGQYVETHREQFRTRAVPVVGDPLMAQWVDEYDNPVGDPVPWSQVISEPVAQAAAEAAAPAAVAADLAGRDIDWEDAGGGASQMTVGGDPVGSPITHLPGNVYSNIVGRPFRSIKEYGCVGDGVTDDTANLQTALNSGFPLYAPEGTYLISNVLLPSYVWLLGAGIGLTIFKQKASSTGPAMKSQYNYSCNFRLCDFTIDGNKANQSAANIGLDIDNTSTAHAANSKFNLNDPRHVISDLMIIKTKGSGMRVQGKGGHLFSRIHTMLTDGHGFELLGYDSSYSQLDAGDSGLCGFYLGPSFANNRISNIKSWFSGQIDRTTYGQGIYLDGAFRNQISVVEVQNSGSHGLVLKGGSLNAISSVFIEFPPSPANSCDGLVLEDSSYNSITGLLINDRGTSPYSLRYGIVFRHGAGNTGVGNEIVGSVISAQSGILSLQGGHNLVKNHLALNGEYAWAARQDVGYLPNYVDDEQANAAGLGVGSMYFNSALGVFTKRQTAASRITTKNSAYTALITDETILVDAVAGFGVTITLPAANTCKGKIFNVKKMDASANPVIVDPNGSETVDGASTKQTTTQWANIRVQSTGSAWVTL